MNEITAPLKKVFFTDYTQPNAALHNGDIDLNSFQHYYSTMLLMVAEVFVIQQKKHIYSSF